MNVCMYVCMYVIFHRSKVQRRGESESAANQEVFGAAESVPIQPVQSPADSHQAAGHVQSPARCPVHELPIFAVQYQLGAVSYQCHDPFRLDWMDGWVISLW